MAPIANSVEKAGSNGCTQYRSENVEKLARNKATLMRRYVVDPRSIHFCPLPDWTFEVTVGRWCNATVVVEFKVVECPFLID